jgi:segregation and condensation protein B
MDSNKINSAIEAILFANGSSVEPARIAIALKITESEAREHLDELKNEYENSDRGITIIKLKDSYQMVSVKEFAPEIRTVMDLRRNTPLSQAALEVLAVIAYNQPVTKSFVEQIRGVDCSGVIGSLTSKDLIEEKGRLELPGRPLIYGTTENFLRCFNVSSIEELPPLPEDNEDEEESGDVQMTVEEVIEEAAKE